MKNSNDKKAGQLGMPIGTAANRLRKSIVFNLLQQLNQNFCFQCGAEIENESELSIEHKIPYLDSENPKELFFDLENVAFSHLSCNCGAGRRHLSHGISRYREGCRCLVCVKSNTDLCRKYYQKTRMV